MFWAIGPTQQLIRITSYNVCYTKLLRRTLELLEENHHFALLLFDIHLPDIKGYDLLCQIRSRNKQLPVIAQSSMYTSENTVITSYSIHYTKLYELYA